MTDPNTDTDPDTVHYSGSSGGFGSVLGMTKVFARELSSPGTLDTLRRQNKPGGYMCSSCAWAKPPEPHAFEFCENGAKTGLTVTPFDLPNGCLGGYYPEMNPLVPLWYHDKASKTPASKGVPVRIERTAPAA